MLPRFATLRDDGELLMSNHLNLNKLPHLFGGPSRRDLLRLASLGALGLPWTGSLLTAPLAAAPPPPVGEIPVFNRFPRMVQEWFVDRLREIERQSLAAKMSLNTKQGRRSLRPLRAAKDTAVFRPRSAKDAAPAPYHRRGGARRLQDRESDFREPPKLSGHRESLHPQGPRLPPARLSNPSAVFVVTAE